MLGVCPPPPPPRTHFCNDTPRKYSFSSHSDSSSSNYFSLSSSSSSSSSSFMSSSSSSTSSGFNSSSTQNFIRDDDNEVYVSSSSCIVVNSPDETECPYDVPYSPVYTPPYSSTYTPPYASTYSPSYSNCSTTYCSCNTYQRVPFRSVFYEDDNRSELQEITCFVGDSEGEDSCSHYEAIYEVIAASSHDTANELSDLPPSPSLPLSDLPPSPSLPLSDLPPSPSLPLSNNDEDDLDSFDSDDESYSQLIPQVCDDIAQDATPQGSISPWQQWAHQRSCSGDQGSQEEVGTPSDQGGQGAQSRTRLAEAANQGIKKLRKNFSVTKGVINRIKRKSFSSVEAKSSENILEEVSSCPEKFPQKWSLPSPFRKKSSSTVPLTGVLESPPPLGETPLLNRDKDSATFYLTLTIAADEAGDPQGLKSEGSENRVPNLQRKSSNTPSIASSTTSNFSEAPSLSHTSSQSGVLRKNSSGASSHISLRPQTAPPAPPTDSTNMSSSNEVSKAKISQKLNQLLLSGPSVPPGRKVLRGAEVVDEGNPVFVLRSTDDSSPVSPSAEIPAEVLRALRGSGPQSKGSVSSRSSSEGYLRPSDLASVPPPLPARPASTSVSSSSFTGVKPPVAIRKNPLDTADTRSYLDLMCESPTDEEPSYMSAHFADEPLYQFYTAKVERAALLQGECSSEDDYEVINDVCPSPLLRRQSRPSAMELVTPRDGCRTLWCELPEVIASGVLDTISSDERKLQEAMFEVITSEASYLKSLEVLVSHFMNCPQFCAQENPVLSRRERKVLFSDIIPVKRCSEQFLSDLERRWQESVRLQGIADIVLHHATSSFGVYVKYCSNQIYQDRMLRELKESNPSFVEVLNRLEASPICQSLAMHSFLMLPMQRVTRLPLLMDAVFNRLQYDTPQWQQCKMALASLTKIVAECNEGARRMERLEEMLILSRQLDFREVKVLPLSSASRWLVKKGELTRLTWRESDARLTFGRKISKHSLFFFLFTDLLVVTKKKSDDQYVVLDYCPRNMVQVLELEGADKFPGRLLDGHKHLIIMTMLQNHENKTVEMVLSCPLESDRIRWIEGVTPRCSDNPDERIYEEWDCPQVQVVHPYVGEQPDELTLEVSDVVNVHKKMADGWYQGERLRDGERGWFPGNHCLEIASAHVRARNLRQRYRLLAISGSFLEELKKEKERIEKEDKKKERRRTLTIKEIL